MLKQPISVTIPSPLAASIFHTAPPPPIPTLPLFQDPSLIWDVFFVFSTDPYAQITEMLNSLSLMDQLPKFEEHMIKDYILDCSDENIKSCLEVNHVKKRTRLLCHKLVLRTMEFFFKIMDVRGKWCKNSFAELNQTMIPTFWCPSITLFIILSCLYILSNTACMLVTWSCRWPQSPLVQL